MSHDSVVRHTESRQVPPEGGPVLYAPEVNVLDHPQKAQQVWETHTGVGAVVVVDDSGKRAGDFNDIGFRCDGVLQLRIVHPVEVRDTSEIGRLDEFDQIVSGGAGKSVIERLAVA